MVPETPQHHHHSQPLKLPQRFTLPTFEFQFNSSTPRTQHMKKRKDVEHEFPSIPPSNSSRKSRRLDAELCTIMEEDPDVMHLHEDPAPAYVAPPEEERALVLYDPTSSTLVKSPSSPEFSIVVNADLIPGLKDYLLSWGIAKAENSVEDKMRTEKSSEVSNDCLAVVPWIASRSPMACEEIVQETGQLLEEEGEMMEMDEPDVNNNNENAMQIGDKVEAVGASSPWQQHCMMLNVLQNTSTPIH